MDKYNIINIDNLFVETLDPSNIIAKLYTGKYNQTEQLKIIKQLNDAIINNNHEEYISLTNNI